MTLDDDIWSLAGEFPAATPERWRTLVNGVLARTVADAALVLDAASGNVEGDRHITLVGLATSAHVVARSDAANVTLRD